MKKFIVPLALLSLLALTACDKTQAPKSEDSSSTKMEESTKDNSAMEDKDADDDSKMEDDKMEDDKMTKNESMGSYTAEEVAKHDSEDDCWFIIDGKVYDLSGFATEHPGGESRITNNCGKDATEDYMTKGGKGIPHSERAMAELEEKMIGEVAK